MALAKVGALWIRENEKGKFWTGEIDLNGVKARVLVFVNRDKIPNSKQPDYRIMVDAGEKK